MSVRASIVVRAFNEVGHLPRLLDALAAQTVRDHEVVLVDSGSVDGTFELAQERCDTVVGIASHDFTYGYSLNRGVAEARADFVAIVSAHAYPADDRWLEHLLRNFEDEQVALVYGRHLPVATTKPSERREFERLFGTARRVQRAPDYYCNNANAAIRRSLWEEHPYDEALTGIEDVAWARYWLDRGRLAVYEPDAAVHHVHEESWPQIERRYYREAYARRRLGLGKRREIPAILADGVREVVRDALREPRANLASVARYRYRMTKGTVRGLVHEYDSELEHQQLFFDRSNPAVVIHEPGKASLDLAPLPDVKPNDVLIEIAYVGVCGTDLEVLHGTLGYYRSGLARYPIVPGHEYSGVVARMGANVDNGLQVGDRVVGGVILGCDRCEACRAGSPISCVDRQEVGVLNHDGAYARFVSIPSQHVHRLPADADLRAHALVEPLAVVQKGLSRIPGLDDGTWACLVVGAGPIGNLAAQSLAARGHAVTVVDRDGARLAALPPAVTGRETELVDLGRFDVVVEATGSADSLREVLDGAGAAARVLLLGFPYGRIDFDFERIVAYDRSVVGSVGSSPDDFRRAIALLPELSLDELTRTIVPLERFEEAWQAQRRHSAVKVLLEVAPPDAE